MFGAFFESFKRTESKKLKVKLARKNALHS